MDSTESSLEKKMIGGVPIALTTMNNAVVCILSAAHGPEPKGTFRLTNAYCVAVASSDSRYLSLLRRTGTNLPDGMPLVWLLRIAGSGRRAHRVRGPSLFEQVLDQGRLCHTRHYFVGVTEEILHKLRKQVEHRFPGVQISGSYAPAFAPISEEMVDVVSQKIDQGCVEIVWVGMGTPKQDFLAQQLAERKNVVAIGIGAAFDFVAGSKAEAPKWVQRSGFEWLYRLGSEPVRLWHRYTVGNIRFMRAVIVHARWSR